MDNCNEAVRMIQYFWMERGNIERYSDWEEQKENFPKIAFALEQIKVWENRVDTLVNELEYKYDCHTCGQHPCACY